MIILEFLVFVISSGLFCSEKFRHHLWAVIVAGAIATGSSLLFAYHMGVRLTGADKPAPVIITKIIKQPVVKVVATSHPASAATPHDCQQDYPAEALNRGEQGVTFLGFKIMTDGTVSAIKVMGSSGSKLLDQAAVQCASHWHYRPAIKNGQLAESDWKASVRWVLPSIAQREAAPEPAPEAEPKPTEQVAASEPAKKASHHWYDPFGWFSGDGDKHEAVQKTP